MFLSVFDLFLPWFGESLADFFSVARLGGGRGLGDSKVDLGGFPGDQVFLYLTARCRAEGLPSSREDPTVVWAQPASTFLFHPAAPNQAFIAKMA